MHVLVGLPRGGRCGGFGQCALANILPFDDELRLFGNDWPPFGYTMVGSTRLENFRAAIDEVNRNAIPGHIIELGVWRGGSMVMAAAVMAESKRMKRDLFLFDIFGDIAGYGTSTSFLAVPEEEVRKAFDSFDLSGPHLHFVKGLFKDTLPAWKDKQDQQIAVLRIDGNFYDSYQDALYYLYEKVPIGGIVIFDDVMSHPSVMRAWTDFKKEQGLVENINRIDKHSAWFRKEKVIKIDWSFFREPKDANKI